MLLFRTGANRARLDVFVASPECFGEFALVGPVGPDGEDAVIAVSAGAHECDQVGGKVPPCREAVG